MASQQLMFAETIAGLKRALKRKSYESDSDEEVQGSSNRGNKLQRRARYVRQGQMTVPSGPEVYKEVIDHAGYQRAIINRNPLPVDEEGYGLDSDDDEDHTQQVLASVAEKNPYSSIRLEHILAPLTTPSDLPNHPTMSRAYTSRTLDDLVLQSRDILQKENQSLWKVKHLLTQLCGDHPWAPAGLMEGENDIDLFLAGPPCPTAEPGPDAQPAKNIHEVEGANENPAASTKPINGDSGANTQAYCSTKTSLDNDTTMTDIDATIGAESQDNKESNVESGETQTKGGSPKHHGAQLVISKNTAPEPSERKPAKATNKRGKGKGVEAPTEMDGDPLANGPLGKTVQQTTRGGEIEQPYIHPLFLQPESSRPDRDFSWPEEEAEELRRVVQLYIQKKEETCRGSQQLYEGLLKGDRLRKKVYLWSKAEAHSGANRSLSDGEDWYDKEEWGLEEDLKKGHDDEEEEAQQNQKKTRNRR